MKNKTNAAKVRTTWENPISKTVINVGLRARLETENGVVLDLVVNEITPGGFILSFPDSKPAKASVHSVVAIPSLPLSALKTGKRVHLKMNGKILPAIVSIITKNGFILLQRENAKGRIDLTDLLRIASQKA
jgi:hypothetical protein